MEPPGVFVMIMVVPAVVGFPDDARVHPATGAERNGLLATDKLYNPAAYALARLPVPPKTVIGQASGGTPVV
jgi:hypothetical protein